MELLIPTVTLQEVDIIAENRKRAQAKPTISTKSSKSYKSKHSDKSAVSSAISTTPLPPLALGQANSLGNCRTADSTCSDNANFTDSCIAKSSALTIDNPRDDSIKKTENANSENKSSTNLAVSSTISAAPLPPLVPGQENSLGNRCKIAESARSSSPNSTASLSPLVLGPENSLDSCCEIVSNSSTSLLAITPES